MKYILFLLLFLPSLAFGCSADHDNWTCNEDLRILAEAIYFEARDQNHIGQEAIAFVIINRVHDDRFPNTIKKVVYQNRKPYELYKCQFSYFCDGKPENVFNDEAWNDAVSSAMRVYLGLIEDHTYGANHYRNPSISKSNWYLAMTKTVTIGDHTFYRW